MKKARATKILCAVLTVIMVLGTGLSAMAAVTSTSMVKYDTANSAYSVTTNVSGLAENEMVTYLVHNASSMYNVAPANIDYIDQKNAEGTTATFNYKGTGDWATKNEKIYVGAESIAAPVESSASAMELGVAVTVNGALVQGLTIDGKSAAGIKKIALEGAAKVVEVKYNGEAVEFFNIDGAIGFYTDAALDDESDVIAITTAGATFVGDPTANGVLSAADIINMGLAVQPADISSRADAVKDGDGALTGYSNGQISSWNGVVANVKGLSGGEAAASVYFYQNTTTLGSVGAYDTSVEVAFGPQDQFNVPGGANEVHTGIAAQYEEAKAAYAAGDTSYTFDLTGYVGQGICLHSSGDDIALELTVPATGNYKLIARQNVWTADRTTNLTINGTTLKAVSDTVQKWSVASSAETIYLEAGQTYEAALDSAASAPVRLDFIALVPATDATETAYAAGAQALIDYFAAGSFTEGVAGIKLGTVKVEGNTLVAFGKAKGAYTECGILIAADDTYVFPALGVAATPGNANGGFAIELIDEDGADLAAEFAGAYVYGYAITDGQDYSEGITSEYEIQ